MIGFFNICNRNLPRRLYFENSGSKCPRKKNYRTLRPFLKVAKTINKISDNYYNFFLNIINNCESTYE